MTANPLRVPGHWPHTHATDFPTACIEYPGGACELELIGPAHLRATTAAVLRGRRQLERWSTNELVDLLDSCAAAWCDPANPVREECLAHLTATTGYARAMLSAALTATFDALRGVHLRALIRRELGDVGALDNGVSSDTGRLWPVPPHCTLVIGGGTVPNATAVPVFTGLLCKSALVVKTPTREPTFGIALARSIAALDSTVGDCLAAGWWPGGSPALDEAAAAQADMVIVTGTDRTVESVRGGLAAGKRLVAYGDRVSAIAVGREKLTGGATQLLWMQIAEAIGWYEQQGCLSPHVVYFEEGGDLSPREAAQYLSEAMALYEVKAPRAPVTAETAAALQTHRDRAEVQAINAERAQVWKAGSTDPAWVVAFDSDPAFTRSPGYRFIHAKSVYDLEDLPTILAKAEDRLQAIALEVSGDRLGALRDSFMSLGISRLCKAHDLQRPPLDWPRDGMPVLGSLVQWVQG